MSLYVKLMSKPLTSILLWLLLLAVVITLLVIGVGWLVAVLFNYTLASMFGWTTITWIQGVGIWVLTHLLFAKDFYK